MLKLRHDDFERQCNERQFLQTLQHFVQDVIAPDLRQLRGDLSSLEKQIDVRFHAVDIRFDAIESQMKSQQSLAQARFEAIMAAISVEVAR